MFKKTALGMASAAIITVAALSGTASTAQAGHFGFSFHGGGVGVHFGGYPAYGYGYGWGAPCWKYKKMWKKTGNPKWKWKFKKCVKWHY